MENQWKTTMFNGKTHYKWAMFNSYVKLPEGNTMVYIYHQLANILGYISITFNYYGILWYISSTSFISNYYTLW